MVSSTRDLLRDRAFLQEEDAQVARKDPDSRGLVTPVPALLVPFEYFRLENHEGI